MTNVVLLVHNRPRLTHQTLDTLYAATPKDQFNLTIVDDGSDMDTERVLAQFASKHRENLRVISFCRPIHIVGFLKNVGAWSAERYFGRGEWLCFIDNDIAFTRGWLDRMEDRLTFGQSPGVEVRILGGYRHPFHQPNAAALPRDEGIEFTDAVAGYMHFMNWATWDRSGPYDQHAKGVCQSEDFAICQKVKELGGRVGYIDPPVIHNCGITNSEGKPAIGGEHFPRIPGLIYE